MVQPVVLQNKELRVACLPGHGMLVTEIVPSVHKENLLWQRQRAPLHDFAQPATATPEFDPFDEQVFAGGWFGMFPNAGIPGVADQGEQMHGTFPRAAWEVVHREETSLSCALEVEALAAIRTLRLNGNCVRIDTTVTNVGAREREVSFGEHPCFSREVFGGGAVSVRSLRACTTAEVSEAGANRFVAGQDFPWPLAAEVGGGVGQADLIPVAADGSHDHLCIALADPRIEITAPRLGGRAIVISDQRSTPHLLFWRHFLPPRSPWHGDVFGIETMSAPGRTRDDARVAGALRVLRPGEVATWHLEVRWESDPLSAYS